MKPETCQSYLNPNRGWPMSKSSLLFSFLLFLDSVWISLPGFSSRGAICYRAPAWKSFMFKYVYSDEVNFHPPKLILDTEFITLEDKSVTANHIGRRYVISEYPAGCDNIVEFFQFGSGEHFGKNYNTFGFYTFSFGDFIVEHFMVRSDKQHGELEIVGAKGRGSMRAWIITMCYPWHRRPLPWKLYVPDLKGFSDGKAYRITFMNYLTRESPIHFLPVGKVSLRFPEYAVIDLMLVDTQGNAVVDVPAIKDLVKIDIVQLPISPQPAKLFFSDVFSVVIFQTQDHSIQIKISDNAGKVRAETFYSLSQQSQAPSNARKQFDLEGFVPYSVTSSTDFPQEAMNDKSIRFLRTVVTHGTCVLKDQKAYIIKHRIGSNVVYVESRASEWILTPGYQYHNANALNPFFLIAKYQTKIVDEKTRTCGYSG
ncbi:hypothetical protein RF11_10509 [Thelohanellus kitauei]|uniref:Uncharacterized protein n=1 Tax=Thelohanellus kitauei TaxID=669202 RepID=A0A0C2JXG2_THEKT|nr:hypothetical protein RF11_10509 [Thelohanellus kitauei]